MYERTLRSDTICHGRVVKLIRQLKHCHLGLTSVWCSRVRIIRFCHVALYGFLMASIGAGRRTIARALIRQGAAVSAGRSRRWPRTFFTIRARDARRFRWSKQDGLRFRTAWAKYAGFWVFRRAASFAGRVAGAKTWWPAAAVRDMFRLGCAVTGDCGWFSGCLLHGTWVTGYTFYGNLDRVAHWAD